MQHYYRSIRRYHDAKNYSYPGKGYHKIYSNFRTNTRESVELFGIVGRVLSIFIMALIGLLSGRR